MHTLPWRLDSDLNIVAFDKVPMPVCNFLCKMAQERGISEVAIWDHELIQRVTPVPSQV